MKTYCAVILAAWHLVLIAVSLCIFHFLSGCVGQRERPAADATEPVVRFGLLVNTNPASSNAIPSVWYSTNAVAVPAKPHYDDVGGDRDKRREDAALRADLLARANEAGVSLNGGQWFQVWEHGPAGSTFLNYLYVPFP